MDISIIARNPPMAFIAAGLVIVLAGSATGNPGLVEIGVWCLVAGFILQLLWLLCVKRGRL